MNMHWEDATFELPPLLDGQFWHLFVNTGDPAHDSYPVWHEPRLENQKKFHMKSRSVIILVGK
ncbi:MAG: hypothetical protein K8I82_07495, partial [Anaerolineae bacterium]|nr:hypothetical protein [Anaerolineae bacterium]